MRQRAINSSEYYACLFAMLTLGLPTQIVLAQAPTSPNVPRAAAAILAARCTGCHGENAKLSALDLSTRSASLKGGAHGPAIVPGSAARSRLYQMISGLLTPKMPPNGQLSASDITILKRWIDAGAADPAGVKSAAAPQTWWSFKRPQWPSIPVLSSAANKVGYASPAFDARKWARNPIDAFVLSKLNEAGLTPSPEADKRTLIRRVTLDLTGLMPTPEEVSAFQADSKADSYQRMIDRLLNSPRYGERWGRHWLDLVRYADSGGFEGDRDRALAWKYRDFVIDSFNKDRPYDQFVAMQVAGDELQPSDRDSIVATGFLACGPVDIVMLNDQNRANELDDIISTTGGVFLGLTLGCARCHDHKYDPITQADYYRLSAVFAPSERRDIDIPTDSERLAVLTQNRAIDTTLAPLKAELEPLSNKGISAAKARGIAKPTAQDIAAALPAPLNARFQDLTSQIAKLESSRPSMPKAMAVTDRARTFPASHLLIRGDPAHPGAEVKPGFIKSLPGGAVDIGEQSALAATTGRRLELAKWITRDSPLLSRVWVNRVWRQHFGRGLVDTPSNFGVSGQLPSHPELLDWLALKFETGGWKTKDLHRLILLSSTYRQQSGIRTTPMAKDPLDRLLWRMPVRRLEAEAIRDSILQVCGTLNLQMGGPPVYPPVDPSLRADTFQGPNWQDGEDGPSTWRRSVYVKVKRSLLLPELEAFDCPEITNSVAARNITTTPTQALMLMNGPFVQRQSDMWAHRLQKEAPSSVSAQINLAFRLAFARQPTQLELKSSMAFLASRSSTKGLSPMAELCHALLNLNEFVYVE